MNPNSDQFFAGFSGVQLGVEEYELGYGLKFRKTYAHLFAPFLMAFAPAEPGEPHRGKWAAVKGGLGFDIHVELFVPKEFSLPEWFDRLNTVWWVTAMLRLRSYALLSVPVLSDLAFSTVPEAWEKADLLPVEVNPCRLLTVDTAKEKLDATDLEWLRDHWLSAGMLMQKSQVFSEAFQAFDSVHFLGRPSVGLLVLWGALEHLFAPAKQELRFRMSASIASFLEPPGKSRFELHSALVKLYDARSRAVHSAEQRRAKL